MARLWIERDMRRPARRTSLVLDRGARAAHLVIERMAQVPAVRPGFGLGRTPHRCRRSVVGVRARAGSWGTTHPTDSCRGGSVPRASGGPSSQPGDAAGELARVGRRIQSLGGGPVRVAVFGDAAILVMFGNVDAEEVDARSGTECRLGFGPARPAIEAPRSYRWARAALRFAQGPGAPPVAHFDQLGSVVALAAVADPDLMDLRDSVALAELSQTETGLIAILTAEVLMRTGSQRDRCCAHASAPQHGGSQG